MIRFGRKTLAILGVLALYSLATLASTVVDVRSYQTGELDLARTRYAIAVAPGAAVYPDGRPHRHTANRIGGMVGFVNSGRADIGVTMSRRTAEPMRQYAIEELGANGDKIKSENSSYSFDSELLAIRNRVLREYLKSVNGRYPDDLQEVTVYLMMQEWAADRLRQDAQHYIRYKLKPWSAPLKVYR